MQKITFINDSAPALNATNLNQMQDNIEDAIDNKVLSGTSLPTTATDDQIFLLYEE